MICTRSSQESLFTLITLGDKARARALLFLCLFISNKHQSPSSIVLLSLVLLSPVLLSLVLLSLVLLSLVLLSLVHRL